MLALIGVLSALFSIAVTASPVTRAVEPMSRTHALTRATQDLPSRMPEAQHRAGRLASKREAAEARNASDAERHDLREHAIAQFAPPNGKTARVIPARARQAR